MYRIHRCVGLLVAGVAIWATLAEAAMAQTSKSAPSQPVALIFDTDIGNDCDDVLALGMIHALQSRGECKLLAVTITKDNPLAGAFVDVVNTFYGRPDIPIGVCHSGVTPEDGSFNVLANTQDDGVYRYPHNVISGQNLPAAVTVLRQALAQAENNSVAIAQVGFSTNLADLLESPADPISPLTGVELVKQKVNLISIMAGAFTLIPHDGQMVEHREYNVIKDIPACQKLVEKSPVPIVWSGFEIGLALPYPHQSILQDFNYVAHHPLAEAYTLYMPPPHDRPTWDLTSVLYAVRPQHDYFDLSPDGTVTVANDGLTKFSAAPSGRDRYLVLREDQKSRVTEALRLLSSQPPSVR